MHLGRHLGFGHAGTDHAVGRQVHVGGHGRGLVQLGDLLIGLDISLIHHGAHQRDGGSGLHGVIGHAQEPGQLHRVLGPVRRQKVNHAVLGQGFSNRVLQGGGGG